MKEISDKEFDGFFKSSFENFEITPSANSWEKITQQMDKKTAKRNFPIFWMAAASVVIVLGFGVVLLKKPGEVVKLRPDQDKSVASVTKVETLDNKNEISVDGGQSIDNTTSVKINKVSSKTYQSSSKSGSIAAVSLNINNPEKNISTDATKELDLDVLNTESVNNKTQELAITKPVKVRSVTEQILADEALNNGKSMGVLPNKVLAAQSKTDGNLEGEGTNPNRKLKIKSVGDLVNFVVAKVDKRNEKIIKMSKTDESDNEITGINLGLFRFSKSEK